jgi:hypothetical protein
VKIKKRAGSDRHNTGGSRNYFSQAEQRVILIEVMYMCGIKFYEFRSAIL